MLESDQIDSQEQNISQEQNAVHIPSDSSENLKTINLMPRPNPVQLDDRIQEAQNRFNNMKDIEATNADYLNRILILSEMCLMSEDLLNGNTDVQKGTLLGCADQYLTPKARRYINFVNILKEYQIKQGDQMKAHESQLMKEMYALRKQMDALNKLVIEEIEKKA